MAGQEFPQCSSIGLPAREFHHTLAQYKLANVRLPRNESALQREDGEDGVRADEELGEEGGDEYDQGAGLGRMRLSLLKMGCRVNVDAPCAVSFTVSEMPLTIRSLPPGL